MTTLENVKNNSNLQWLLNQSEVTFEDSDCKMTFFKGKLPKKMWSDLWKWFVENEDHSGLEDKVVKCGLGSLTLVTSKWKGNTEVTFTTCLGK